MLFNQFENILSESSFGGDASLVEATNNGYNLEDMTCIILESTQDLHKVSMGGLTSEAYCAYKLVESSKLGTLNESTLYEAEMLQEKVNLSIFDNIKKIIKKVLAKIKEIINNLKMQFIKLFNQKAWLSEAKNRLKNVSDFNDAKIDGYNFTIDALDPEKVFEKARAVVDKKAKEIIDAVVSDNIESVEDAKEKNKTALKSFEEFKDSMFEDEIAKAVDADSISELGAQFSKVCRDGKDSTDEITITGTSDAFKCLDKLASASSKLKSVEQRLNTVYSSTIKEINKKENEYKKLAEKAEKGDKYVAEIKKQTYTKQAERIGTVFNIAIQASKAKLEALNAEAKQSKTLISKALAGSKAAKKKGVDLSESGLMSAFIPTIY